MSPKSKHDATETQKEAQTWQTPKLIDLNDVRNMTQKSDANEEFGRFLGPYTSPGGGTTS